MEKIIQQILQLGIWKPMDIYISDMLLKCIPTCNFQKKMALKLASACLTSNINMGHTCLPISVLNSGECFHCDHNKNIMKIISKKINISTTEAWQELLLSLPIISDGTYPAPLILENQCLYLHRMWKDECIIAKFFCYKNKKYNLQKNKIINILKQLFLTNSSETNWNKIAVTISMISQKTFISGGPGTGKTSNIVKIIIALLLLKNNNLQIKITTPTGKSATILTEILQKQIKNIILPNNYSISKFPKKATTLHNLIGSQSYNKKNIFRDYINTLNLDILIIDEASMMSLSILARLIDILPSSITIILIGDHHQLYPVEPGSIFQDLCKLFNMYYYSPNRQKELEELTGYSLIKSSVITIPAQYINIIDNTCILKKNYRFNQNSDIHQLATSINSGNSSAVLSLLNSKIHNDLNYLYIKKQKDYISMINNCAMAYYNYLQNIHCSKKSIKKILKIFNNYRILCAVRNGPFGIIQINHYIEQILNQKQIIQLNHSNNYIGKPIIILQNEPLFELSNGDVGILLLNSQHELSAYFMLTDNTVKTIPIDHLPKHETCFAMTIHKSQGSEFETVSIILPYKHTSILTRELLYTAVTRARHNLFLYATDDIIVKSINLLTKRWGNLHKKIKTIANTKYSI